MNRDINEDRLKIFQNWTPKASEWSKWVKPVLFTTLTNYDVYQPQKIDLPTLEWAVDLPKTTAVIIDLPGEEAILESLALSSHEFHPVILLNCCKAPSMLIDLTPITKLLKAGGEILSQTPLGIQITPAFVLDSRRKNFSSGYRFSNDFGMFDNRWLVVPQDMPSADYLKDAGITNIVVRTDEIQRDLIHILYRYQKSGIKIKICKDNLTIYDHKITKPRRFNRIAYRWLLLLGLRRNAAGGFGGAIPEVNNTSGMG